MKGFTLIELLVVVLIIGILAAVALPSYNKAVEKSQAVEGVGLMKSLIEAVSRYDLANKECPTDVDELDIDIPSYTDSSGNTYKGGKYFKIYQIGLMGNTHYCSVVLQETKPKYKYYFQTVIDRRNGQFKRYCLSNPVVNIASNNIDGYTSARKPSTAEMEQMCNAITNGHNTDGLW